MIKVLYFARFREELGCAEEQLNGIESVDQLLSTLKARGEPWSRVLDSNVLCAVNQVMTKGLTPLKDGDEVGIFPPVTGG
jgi:molybdopterin synthase sulfur carrier subunit